MSVLDDVGTAEVSLPADVRVALDALAHAAALLRVADLDALDARSELDVVRQVEVARRQIDHATSRLADHLDTSQAFVADGLRSARAALRHLGRMPSAEASARVEVARVLRQLPVVDAAFAAGRIPTAHVRAIARVASNPRVRDHLDDVLFARRAVVDDHATFCRWLRSWEQHADADGAEDDAETSHRRRHVELVENFDGGFTLDGAFGGLQGAALREVLDRFVDAETLADWADARNRLGDLATPADLARTPAQRRADALVAIFRRAASTSPGGREPRPLVNIVVDIATFEAELARLAGVPQAAGPSPASGAVCRTTEGTPLQPSDAVAAALVGHVRRVVVDARSNVIDLGRRRRFFTGSARDAAVLQGALQHPDGVSCLWPGCQQRRGLQVDHVAPAARGGRTDQSNAVLLCGHHNRLKQHRWRPVRGPDGTWTVLRPDGTQVTPPA